MSVDPKILEKACRAAVSDYYSRLFNKPLHDPHVTTNVDGNWNMFEHEIIIALETAFDGMERIIARTLFEVDYPNAGETEEGLWDRHEHGYMAQAKAVKALFIKEVKVIREFTPEEKIEKLLEALSPLVKIADCYDKSELDEERPEWREKGIGHSGPLESVELFSGRGGQRLLTLGDAFKARDLYNELKKS